MKDPLARLPRALREALPRGQTLPDSVWRRRHRWMLWLLWAHVPFLTGFALAHGYGPLHSLAHGLPLVTFAVLATAPLGFNRRVRGSLVALGLLTASALLVHSWDGVIEAHFHFFVMIGVLALYEDWVPFLIAASFVLLHHGVLGAIDRDTVYAHSGSPWGWAVIHALFVTAAGITNIAAWRMNEDLRDETERALAEVRHQALHDPLTGLPNRNLFMDRLEHALARSRRPGIKVAVFFIDLDCFKAINDSLGHSAGDRLLVEVGRRLTGALRPADTVSRFGGDEFTLLCEDVVDERHAEGIAERVAEVTATPFALDGLSVTLTPSIGIAIAQDEDVDAEVLLRNADTAMYIAKERGRGRHEFYDSKVSRGMVKRLEGYDPASPESQPAFAPLIASLRSSTSPA